MTTWMGKELLLLFLLAFCMGTDLCDGKIYNRVIAAGYGASVVLSVAQGSVVSIRECVLGAALPIVCLYLLFVVGVLGAGDVKLLSVIGAFLGVQGSLWCMLASIVLAGVYGLFKLLHGRLVRQGIRQLLVYAKGVWFGRRLSAYVPTNSRTTLHFSVPVYFAVICFLEGCLV